MSKAELPIVAFETKLAFKRWLEKEHSRSDGIWLKFAKKESGIKSVVYAEALEVALCYGWIDGQIARFDDEYYLQRFTPRRAKSKWSKINREKAEALIRDGKVQPAGLTAIEAAKADGRWDAAYESARNATVPDDLAVALDARPKAKAFFESLTGSRRYSVLYRIQDAKRADTRARRIAKFVADLEKGKSPLD